MPTDDTPSVVPAILSDLFAIVLPGDRGGVDVRWNAGDRTWLHSSSYGSGFVRQEPPHRVGTGDFSMMTWLDAPSADDIRVAVSLAESLRKVGYCEHCGHDALQLHAVSPDIFGELALSCVLRPDPAVVGSYGGGGRVKHWGSTYGCHSVRSEPVYRRDTSRLIVGHYLYGEPLTTLEALERAWCSRCQGTASNVRFNKAQELAAELGHEPSDRGQRSRNRGR